MVEGITEWMRERLLTLSYADLVGGLVVPLKTKKSDVEKTVPAYKRLHLRDECDEGDYVYMIPNDKKKSVIFVEHVSDRIVDVPTERWQDVEYMLNVVCWYNFHATDRDVINSLPYQAEMVSLFNKRAQNITYTSPTTGRVNRYYGVVVEPVNGVRREQVWSRYTLPELKSQYGMYPYDYFAIQFRVSCREVVDCFPNIEEKTTGCVAFKPEEYVPPEEPEEPIEE
jgi:hypothetical protein